MICAIMFAALPSSVTAAELPKKATPPPRDVKGNPCPGTRVGSRS